MSPEFELTPEALPLGLDGILIRFALQPSPVAIAAAQSFTSALNDHCPKGIVEVSPAMVSVLVRYDRTKTTRKELASKLLKQAKILTGHEIAMPLPSRRWTIPAAFDSDNGPNLSEVASLLDMPVDRVVAEICEQELSVLAIGFAPGQPYMGLLPDHWNFPRMSALNPKVPVGAVVTAVRQVIIYSAEGTTGWRQIGRTAFRTFLVDRDQPIPLKPTDAIRFAAVSSSEIEDLEQSPDGLGGAKLEVLS